MKGQLENRNHTKYLRGGSLESSYVCVLQKASFSAINFNILIDL